MSEHTIKQIPFSALGDYVGKRIYVEDMGNDFCSPMRVSKTRYTSDKEEMIVYLTAGNNLTLAITSGAIDQFNMRFYASAPCRVSTLFADDPEEDDGK